MSYAFLYTQFGSFFLGVTFAFALLFRVAAGHTPASGSEGCLGVLLCTLGVSIAVVCYIAAVNA